MSPQSGFLIIYTCINSTQLFYLKKILVETLKLVKSKYELEAWAREEWWMASAVLM